MIAMMYHDIESADRLNEKRGTSAYLYVTPAEAFRRQLELIRSLGLRVSTWSGYLQAMRTGRADLSRTVILTFDDGHESVESVAMPIMNEFGFAGTTQVISGFVGKPNKYTLNDAQLRRLRQAGWDIGGHGFNHIVLTELDDETLAFELREAKRVLEQVLREPVEMMSIPHGPYSRRVRSAIINAGYQAAFCSSPGINQTGTDRFSLRRMTITQAVDLPTFRQIVTLDPCFYMKEGLRRFGYRTLQRLIGSKRYEIVRASLLRILAMSK